METENSKRKLKCKGGGVRETIVNKGFGYIDFGEMEEQEYTPDMSEITVAVANAKSKLQQMQKDYVFLHDIGKEFKWDRSNLRKFTLRHNISTIKFRHPELRQQCLAITKKDAKRLMELKFGG
jgi:hypothetical protein